jgi:ectoine hydroxylase-related dioxygenase (phytanoyl-CoA dioxygenase family)
MGALGHYRSYREGDLLDDYPELREVCAITGPVAYAAGDVTVHSNLTVHGAGENLTERPRWAYTVIVNPGDVRWNGGPVEAYDTAGMIMLQPLDDERFPIIG